MTTRADELGWVSAKMPKVLTPLDALCLVIREGKWRALSLTREQAKTFQDELAAAGYAIVKKQS